MLNFCQVCVAKDMMLIDCRVCSLSFSCLMRCSPISLAAAVFATSSCSICSSIFSSGATFEPETFFSAASSTVEPLKDYSRERHPLTWCIHQMSVCRLAKAELHQTVQHVVRCCSSGSLLLEVVSVWASTFPVAPVQASFFKIKYRIAIHFITAAATQANYRVKSKNIQTKTSKDIPQQWCCFWSIPPVSLPQAQMSESTEIRSREWVQCRLCDEASVPCHRLAPPSTRHVTLLVIPPWGRLLHLLKFQQCVPGGIFNTFSS